MGGGEERGVEEVYYVKMFQIDFHVWIKNKRKGKRGFAKLLIFFLKFFK